MGKSFGYGEKNPEGERILETSIGHDQVISHTCLLQWNNHLMIYQTREESAQIDYMLLRPQNRKECSNFWVLPVESSPGLHWLLIVILHKWQDHNTVHLQGGWVAYTMLSPSE